MFDNNKWVYTSALVVVALVGLFMNSRQKQYSLIDTVNATHKRDKAIYIAAFIMVGYIVYWAAIRNAFVDTSAYIEGYKNLDASKSIWSAWQRVDGDFTNKAPLFRMYELILRKMGFHWHFFLGSIAVYSGVCIAYGIGRHTDDVALSCYLFIATHSFLWLFNGARQMIVIATMFAALRLIYEKKLVKFLILFAIMYFVHSTCIIFIPLYFIANMKPWSYGIYICILVTIVMTVAFPGRITAMLDSSFEEYNVAEQFAEDDGVSIFRFLVAMVPPAIAFVYRKQLMAFEDRRVNVLTNIALINGGLYAVAVVTSGVYMGRIPAYTEIYNIVFLPFLLKRAADKRMRNTLMVAAIILYFVFYALLMNDVSYYSTDVFEGLKMWDVT